MSRSALRYADPRPAQAFAGHDPDVPVAGFYRMRLRSGGVFVGVRIWHGLPIDPATGDEMDRAPCWNARINGAWADLSDVWPKCAGEPTTQREAEYLADMQEWGKRHAPAGPQADPMRRVNMLTAPLPLLKGPTMATAFNDRAVIGGNNPPLEERILMDFDEALRDHDGLLARIDQMVARADQAEACTSQDLAGRYGDFVKMAGAAVKVIEAERELLNRPLLTAQRALKARADLYSGKASGAGIKVRAKLDAFLAEEERKRVAEERRVAEEARKAEAERQRVIEEARRKAAAEAEAERQRLQAIADREAAAERARLQAIEDERAAAEARQAKPVEVVAEVVEVQPEPVFVPEPEPVFVPTARPVGPLRGDYGTAVSTVETWHVEIVNVRQVPDIFLKNEAVVEALRKVIGPMVRGKNGLREIKGCRVYSTIGSSVR